MHRIFSLSGQARVQALASMRSLLVFDFDGTLAPIVRNPDQAAISDRLARLLRELQSRHIVAVLSGRKRADLLNRLPFVPDYAIGNHGAEGLDSNARALSRCRRITTRWQHELESKLREFKGVWVENKVITLSLHFRGVSRPAEVERRLIACVSELTPEPRRVPGKSVINLVPPGAPDKGGAMLALLRKTRLPAALFVGDDWTDEDVFRLEDPRVLMVRVGKEPRSRARFYVERQAEVARLLEQLLP